MPYAVVFLFGVFTNLSALFTLMCGYQLGKALKLVNIAPNTITTDINTSIPRYANYVSIFDVHFASFHVQPSSLVVNQRCNHDGL